jgi:hypothetical protein
MTDPMTDPLPEATLGHLMLEIGKLQGSQNAVGREVGLLRADIAQVNAAHAADIKAVHDRLEALEDEETKRAGRYAMLGWLTRVPNPVWAALAGAAAIVGIHLEAHTK